MSETDDNKQLESRLECANSLADRFHKALLSAYKAAISFGGNPRHGELDTTKAIEDLGAKIKKQAGEIERLTLALSLIRESSMTLDEARGQAAAALGH